MRYAKRAFCLLVCVFLLLPVFALAETESGMVRNSKAGNRVNLRAQPGGAIVLEYYTGTPVKVLEQRSDGWVKVDIYGSQGYMRREYVAIGSAEVQRVTPNLPSRTVRDAAWKLYASASTQASQTSYGRGTHVKVLGYTGKWYHVALDDGTTGFVYGPPAGITGASQSSSGSGSIKKGSATVKNRTPGTCLTLRAKPNTRAQALGRYYTGVSVKVLSDSKDGWAYVSVAGVKGYMLAEYLTDGSVDSAMPTVKVTASSVNLRGKASASGKFLARLEKGTEVTVMGVSGKWLHVSVNGKTGYVRSSYLSSL